MAEAVEVGPATLHRNNVEQNPAQELLVVLRPPKERGHGKRRSGQTLVTRSAEERWFIAAGLSPQLTAPKGNRPHTYVSGTLKAKGLDSSKIDGRP